MTAAEPPTGEEVVRGCLPLDPALYSLWQDAVIQGTSGSPAGVFDEIICDDEIHVACVNYLLRHGAPVFVHPHEQAAYMGELQRQLAAGLVPHAAREAALHSHGPSTSE
jgi:hypothetical protein